MEVIFAVIITGLGVLYLVAAVHNPDLLMNSYKARHVIDSFGEKGARIFYGFIGIFLTLVGIIFFFASL